MSGGKTITLNVSSKVAVAAALGAGVVVGAGTAYLLTRLNEHTRLTQQISSLHATILEVKKDIASLETGLTHKDIPWDAEDFDRAYGRTEFSSPRASAFRKKTVSFSSTTTSGSYKTAPEYDTDSSKANDTDYFSPDEDDDEFFDLSPEEEEGVNSYGENGKIESGQLSSLLDEEDHLYQLFKQVDQVIDGTGDEQTQAYNLLKNEENEYADNPEFLWRVAKATRNMAAIQEKLGNEKDKETLICDAFGYAAKALDLDKENAEIHKWYAILAGARGEFLGIRERVKSGTIFKKHIDRALQLKAKDSTLHHLLGRFCYEVSQLSWLEKRAATALFGEVPSSTYEEALHHFTAAEMLRPSGWKENRLFVAKCHIQLNNYSTAASWLERAAVAPIITPDDEIVQKEVLELQDKYS
ncbi:regulator of microtubule dynamics protein 1-like isoform X1 [Homarus americanus]|uniref:regulator of microtubule dynamics protein 1-like isoform X1 n=1 Tax=Homarus americanus TaxID=6706 RepID=UPI001C4793A4|nr:regulator of microtubule dynamics protein 1-like isoform X1 [Homarus americanus]XP_042238884.1 regulator of microtubule dynamics protein 1-like isoform X1 [Homarus americanus]